MTIAAGALPRPSRPPRPPRSRTRRIADIVTGVTLALIAGVVAFGLYTVFFSLRAPNGTIATQCASSGATCDQSLLNTICYIGYAVCLFGWGLPVAFMIVRFIRNRLAWFFPLISIVVVIAGFYILLAILGRNYGA